MQGFRAALTTPLRARPLPGRALLLWLAMSLVAALPAQAETTKTPSAKTSGSQSASKSAEKKASAKKSNSSSAANTKKKSTAQKVKSSNRQKNKKSSTTARSQSDLERVQQQIRSTEQRIKLTREQREQKEAELRAAEIEIGQLKGDMGEVQKDVRTREQRLADLQAEKKLREQDRDRLVNQIRGDLQMAQRQGSQDYYKLLLNQQDPQALARLMKYYGYMQHARSTRVQTLNETLARLDLITREEEENVQRLHVARTELEQKQTRLSSAQQQRSQAIRLLSAQIESEDEKLQRLKRDQAALQAVMERVAREAAEREQRERREAELRRQEQAARANSKSAIPEAPGEKSVPKPLPPPPVVQEDVKAMPYKGRCPLPVAGGVRSGFGSARAGGLRWNGIVIDAPGGTAVRAIRPGRVAFADYLRGYGFLIIVDHGRGLMSLYGQNQSLQKKAGDSVGGNEVIATVGDGGGNEIDGLYFEIRVRGRPTDPAGWCAYQ